MRLPCYIQVMETQILEGTPAEVGRRIGELPLPPGERIRVVVSRASDPNTQRASGTSHVRQESKPSIDAEQARALADDYLGDEIGDLLWAEDAHLAEEGASWHLTVVLGNAIRGRLGAVGTIAVDTRSGEIRELTGRAELLDNADRLSGAPTP
jgi:hypothetical protein